MQIKTLSLIMSAVLIAPSIAMAAPANKAAAEKQTVTTESTLDAKAAEQSVFVISETQTVSRARVNSNLGQQPMTTEIKAPNGQQPMTTEIKAPNGQQPMTTEIKAPAEALQDPELQTTEIISNDPVLDEPEDLAEASEEDDL